MRRNVFHSLFSIKGIRRSAPFFSIKSTLVKIRNQLLNNFYLLISFSFIPQRIYRIQQSGL